MSSRLSILVTLLVGTSVALAHTQRYAAGIAADYELIPNVAYLEAGAWQGKLDLYVRADTREPVPTLLFFHGGSDDRGKKETELFYLLRYLELGWNVVNVEHRLSRGHPGSREDSERHLRASMGGAECEPVWL